MGYLGLVGNLEQSLPRLVEVSDDPLPNGLFRISWKRNSTCPLGWTKR